MIGTKLESQQKTPGPARTVWNFVRRYPILPVMVFVMVLVLAVFVPLIAPFEPDAGSIRIRNLPPFWLAGANSDHLLGTDPLGRDIFSRTIFGARIAVIVAGSVLIAGGIGGTAIGMLAGYKRGWFDELAMRAGDFTLAMPCLLVALTVVVVFGQSLTLIIVPLILFSWDNFARVVRAEALGLTHIAYVEAARVSGASTTRIILRHILPGVFGTVLVVASLRVGQLILIEATLSFLGAGLPKNVPAWGVMVAAGQDFLQTAWWVSAVPGAMIFIVVMGFNFLGDWLRDWYDPKLRQQIH